ncbi:uroporphyrinogen decarboxylase [Candidatus Marsarchaeota G2 archaeon ECH_B_SAG-E12]|uniref:Uroporphyrinogen decarboxylase n=1 Tax=Candidatus Marsarchaeota G2 archaeon ECH_B_SAG-E12 TaxID=1978164 RepID=A0A2R6BXA7_9ARCH|nr:MAG: uroporphyrinogen decarboxylase [Candidatus Marsarchaeota G2 archaeon ECH_B_SAG-E12]
MPTAWSLRRPRALLVQKFRSKLFERSARFLKAAIFNFVTLFGESTLLTFVKSNFIRACYGKDVDVTPVWFMRQAGRYLPGYRRIRKNHTLLEIIKKPELALKVVFEPIERFGFDAAIVFSDIILPLKAWGVSIKEEVGPVTKKPVRTPADVDSFDVHKIEEEGYILEQIRLIKKRRPELPVIGFTGAPFTLATYLIEGKYSRNFESTKSFFYESKVAWHKLLEKIERLVANHLKAQVGAGVDAVQIFDSWVGALSPFDFEEYVLEHVQSVLSSVKGVPRIYFGTCTAGLLSVLRKVEAEVISVDWRIRLKEAHSILGESFALQGNLDPSSLLAPTKLALRMTKRVLEDSRGVKGYIFNLGHGVPPNADPRVVSEVVKLVHSFRR